MRKKILILILLLVANMTPAISKQLELRAKTTRQKGYLRIPSATRVSADYENGIVTLYITAYTGNVQICIYDSEGNIVESESSFVSGSGTLTVDIDVFEETDYIITVALNDTVYYGRFEA